MEQSNVRITTETFEEFLATHREGLYELIDGEIVEKMVTEEHGGIALNIGSALHAYLKKNKIGLASVEARYAPVGDKYNDRLPDVSFRRTDAPRVKKGAVQGMPDLAVEIKSPDDSNKQMRATADFYIANGAKMVWLVFPDKKLVEVHRPDGNYETYLEGDTISGGELLPDFSITVAEIFE
jgi:Uma2 family endonuclease